MNNIISFFLVTFCFFSCKKTEVELPYSIDQQSISDSAMVVTAHSLSSEIGKNILQKGGNAIDATIATQFALAVVYPRAGNIGGGGFMIIRMADGQTGALDYREKAPAKASRNMYLDEKEEVIPGLSTYGALAVGVPGTVAGMEAAHKKYGTLDWKTLIQPAIDLAQNGFPITQSEADRFAEKKSDIKGINRFKTPFVKFWGWNQGDILKQTDLAKTLERIRDNGKDGFYKGKTAQLFVDEMEAGNGLITKEDLENYAPVWRAPIIGNYKGYKIISMPPASSGGIALTQMFEMAEQLPLKEMGFHKTETIHAMAEIMRRAFADRAEHLGDSDHYDVPIDKLTDSTYLVNKISNFNKKAATGSDSILAGNFKVLLESFETTHTSIIDKDGNSVSVTTTLNTNYGSKLVVKGGGFFLNNEMDDFSSKPGVPNYYGLVGAEANAIAPNKRMLSSMTPTIVEKDGKVLMSLGSPGGSTIITAVFQVIMNVLEFDKSLDEAVAAGRFHHQWLPDQIMMEEGKFSNEVIEGLKAKGHEISLKDRIAKVKAIMVRPDGKLHGVGDPRLLEDDTEGY